MQALACMPCAQFNFKMVDLLNPLATIQWKRRSGFPEYVNDVVQFKGKLIASGGTYIADRLWEADSDFSNWKTLEQDLPTCDFGLSTYHSQLVLVGGEISGRPTNKVWVSDDGYSWNTSLPPMPTARRWPTVVNTGTPEYLLVAGGDPCEKVVEVFMEGQWWSLLSLSYNILPYHDYTPATIHGGTLHICNAYCDLQALLASRQPPNSSMISDPDGLWNVVNHGYLDLFHFKGSYFALLINNSVLITMIHW
jgi:hypothetical protein